MKYQIWKTEQKQWNKIQKYFTEVFPETLNYLLKVVLQKQSPENAVQLFKKSMSAAMMKCLETLVKEFILCKFAGRRAHFYDTKSYDNKNISVVKMESSQGPRATDISNKQKPKRFSF